MLSPDKGRTAMSRTLTRMTASRINRYSPRRTAARLAFSRHTGLRMPKIDERSLTAGVTRTRRTIPAGAKWQDTVAGFHHIRG